MRQSTHMTTFPGDMATIMMKILSISEGRAQVPKNCMKCFTRPFDIESATVKEGLYPPTTIDQRPNDRTSDQPWVGPMMHRTEFVDHYGAHALPPIPWVALANPERYKHILPEENPKFTRVW